MFLFRLKVSDRRAGSLVILLLMPLTLNQSSQAGIFSLDEGERLSEQIGRAAKQVLYQPHPPFEPPYPGLTVSVEKGHGGFCSAHVRYAGVPRSLNITKYGRTVEIVLRKTGDEVDVVSLR